MVELLVVISIIGLLLAILVPTVARARALGWRAACSTNLRDIARGCQVYAKDESWNRRNPDQAYTTTTPFIPGALPSVGPTTGNWSDPKNGNMAAMWLLATGLKPGDPTTAIKNSWTSLSVFVCPEASSRLGRRAPSLADGGFKAETLSYGYLSQVPITVPAVGSLPARTWTGTSIYDAKSSLALVADANPHPGIDKVSNGKATNSLNHSQEGQNVGKLDGSVAWITTSMIELDDIYQPDTMNIPDSTQTTKGVAAEGRRSVPNDSLILN